MSASGRSGGRGRGRERGRGRDFERGSGRGRERGNYPGHCIRYKLLGECDSNNRGECHFRHEKILPEDKIFKERVKIPAGLPIAKVIGTKGASFKPLTKITECGIKVLKEERAVMIVTTDKAKLPLLVKTFVDMHTTKENSDSPSSWYIHPVGIASGSLYWFNPCNQGQLPPGADSGVNYYELIESADLESAPTADGASVGLQTAVQEDHDEKIWKQSRVHPEEDIQQRLKTKLEWLCSEERWITRLDACFGNLLLDSQSIPEEVPLEEEDRIKYSFEKFADIVFSNSVRHAFFSNVRSIEADLLTDKWKNPFSMETFDVQLTCFGARDTGDKLDVCLLVKRDDDIPVQVLNVKRNEVKNAAFEVRCFHRPYDVCVCLHHYIRVGIREPLHVIAEEMARSMSFHSHDRVKFQSKTAHWNVNRIQHKCNRTYLMDEKYAFTISAASEHTFNGELDEWEEFDLQVEPTTHTEVELHSLAWECAFGRDAGLTPDKSLALYMEKGRVGPAVAKAIPHPWQPDDICRDFHEFWDRLDTLNECLEIVW